MLEELDAAMLLEPNDPMLHYNKAVFLSQLRRLEEAIHEYQTAVKLNPYLYEAYFNLGMIREAMGDDEGAVSSYTQFIEVAPKSSESYVLEAQKKITQLQK